MSWWYKNGSECIKNVLLWILVWVPSPFPREIWIINTSVNNLKRKRLWFFHQSRFLFILKPSREGSFFIRHFFFTRNITTSAPIPVKSKTILIHFHYTIKPFPWQQRKIDRLNLRNPATQKCKDNRRAFPGLAVLYICLSYLSTRFRTSWWSI